jgi:hypothetical protein
MLVTSNHSDHRWMNGPHGPCKRLATVRQRLPTLDKEAIENCRANEPAMQDHAPADGFTKRARQNSRVNRRCHH